MCTKENFDLRVFMVMASWSLLERRCVMEVADSCGPFSAAMKETSTVESFGDKVFYVCMYGCKSLVLLMSAFDGESNRCVDQSF